MAKVFSNVQFDINEMEMAYEAAKHKILKQGGSTDDKKSELAKQLKTAQGKLANLIEMISSDPDMKETLKPKILSLKQDVETITKQISDLGKITPEQQLATLEQTKKAFLQANSASFDYLSGDNAKKFELLKKLLWNLKLQDGNTQCFQLKQPYQLIAESPKKLEIFQWWAG